MPLYTASVDIWQHHASTARTTTVVPDGCCDLIWHALPGTVGERYCGYRMQPGTHIHRARLLAAVAARSGCDAADILPILHDCMHLDAPVHDALLALAHSPSTPPRWPKPPQTGAM